MKYKEQILGRKAVNEMLKLNTNPFNQKEQINILFGLFLFLKISTPLRIKWRQ